ncbi:hypothetical protein BABINDRAFT_162996 [Babjeviella inositovora NRRL Y-12698]|uniref:Major facilitator superfamily (MFS) profile domain-containing protein n=1 Tax=Babjeviella inositovora NRRL Y-12698 TaxID=984486 RepID=A0A1E3QLI7_9ASCO|nr:uncharacterized protein BABINDRAFT_162996 [Babjeviella inositovora NRRL Y-12698]ODQ77942.1 hypothetical protein BABINDRAFT_162996 [Babjeviella inositovora NRRL Y-12698]
MPSTHELSTPTSDAVPSQGPKLDSVTIKRYIKTRFTELLPTRAEWDANKHNINPFSPLSQLTRKNWAFFGVAICAWTWDAFDFFAVSLNASKIAASLDVTVKDITWGITLVLMLRSVGSIGFGIWGDRCGNKYPLITCLVLLIIIQIGTGFINSYAQFLGVRAIFGIAMGGIYGNAASCALDDCPVDARGIISGMFQEAYALGYLLAVVFQRAIVDNSPKGWRAIFWFSAGPPVLFIAWRLSLPQTDAFIRKMEVEDGEGVEGSKFWKNAKESLRTQWLMFVYLVLLMAGFNFSSHGSQDLYPTLLSKQLNYGEDRSTVTNSVANFGAIAGGVVVGHASTFVGRRFAIMLSCVLGGAMIYPWAFVRNSGINAGAFFLQFFVQGAWGVVPAHISSLADPKWRSFIVGTSYQLGNLASSASSTIEATIGEKFPLFDSNGQQIVGAFNYSKVMAIFMGCVFAFLLLVTFIGPEVKESAVIAHMRAQDSESIISYQDKPLEEQVKIVGDEENQQGAIQK